MRSGQPLGHAVAMGPKNIQIQFAAGAALSLVGAVAISASADDEVDRDQDQPVGGRSCMQTD